MVGVTLGNQISVLVVDTFTGATAGAGDNVNVPAVIRLLGGTPASVVHAGGTAGTEGEGTFGGNSTSGFFIPDAATLRVSAGGLTFKAQTRVNANSGTNSGYTAFTVTGAFDGLNIAVGQHQSSGLTNLALDPTAANYKTLFFAANTTVGGVGLNAAFANNTGLVDAKTYIVGASYPLSDAMSVGAIYARGTAALGNQTSVNLKYSLSKSTVAYVTTSMFSVDQGGTVFSNTGNGAIGAGARNATAVGISHSF